MSSRRHHAVASLAALVVFGSTGAGVPGAGADTLASPARATPVDARAGDVLWSAFDAAAGGFRLTVRQPNGSVRVVSTAVSAKPIEARLGDDVQGRPVVVYAACAGGASNCDVHVISLADGRDEPVPVAARPNVNEHAPAIDHGRLAWIAEPAGGGKARVLVTTLSSKRQPVSLPTLPSRRCITQVNGLRRCGRLRGSVTALAIRGTTVAEFAQTTLLSSRGGELRLVDVRHRTSGQVLSFGAGEGGQTLLGPSFDGSYLYAYKTCTGDPSGCRKRAGTYRVRLSDGRVQLAPSEQQLSGFAADGAHVVTSEGSEAAHCEIDQGGYPGLPGVQIGPCPITANPLPSAWQRPS